MLESLGAYLQYPFVRRALLVGTLISVCAALLGNVLVHKRLSFLGDGLSHVAFGAFAVAGVLPLAEKTPFVLGVTLISAVLLLRGGKKASGDALLSMLSVSILAVGYLLLKTGFCSTQFLTFLREADRQLLSYRVLRPGDTDEDVLALKGRLQTLGYIRAGAEITDYYSDLLKERVILFQRETGMTENGVASQKLQIYLYSDQAPVCTQTLPKARSAAKSEWQSVNRVICGCCWGEGCECCNETGWIYY